MKKGAGFRRPSLFGLAMLSVWVAGFEMTLQIADDEAPLHRGPVG